MLEQGSRGANVQRAGIIKYIFSNEQTAGRIDEQSNLSDRFALKKWKIYKYADEFHWCFKCICKIMKTNYEENTYKHNHTFD